MLAASLTPVEIADADRRVAGMAPRERSKP
jgi:hypothetical protein